MGFHRWPVYRRVLVNLHSGQAFDALLVAKRGALLELADATLLEAGAEPAVLDGRVYVERSNVAFIQAKGGGS